MKRSSEANRLESMAERLFDAVLSYQDTGTPSALYQVAAVADSIGVACRQMMSQPPAPRTKRAARVGGEQ
jgi:hypothetical protein